MKKRKIFKKITLAGLAACMFCLPILAGCAPAEMLPEKPSQGQNFDLGLNPETDPVVYTTQSGLEIKKSNSNSYSGTKTLISNYDVSHIQDLTNFYYFTMGSYSGTIYTGKDATDKFSVSGEPVNWLIIGRGAGFNFETSTPAGNGILNDRDKQEIAGSNTLYLPNAFTSVPEHSDIPKGCFLVLSEKLLGHAQFNGNGAAIIRAYNGYSDCNLLSSGAGSYGNRYRYISSVDVAGGVAGSASWTTSGNAGGMLYNYINNLFSKNTSGTILKNGLGFTQAQSDMIVPQQLYTYYSNGVGYNHQETPSTDGNTYYTMFPLACRNSVVYQNFCLNDYLFKPTQYLASFIGSSQAYTWHTRSGIVNMGPQAVYRHYLGGGFNYSNVDGHFGVRPAFVISLAN